MNKSNMMITILNFYPMMINFFMIMLMSMPCKNNKFNPITLILILILLTLMISMKINFLINSWSSMILFLIMIGGLMIIFLYITSLANNELFLVNYKIIFINLIKILPLIFMMFIFNINFSEWNNSNLWINMNFNNLNLNFYQNYVNPYKFNTMFIMNYLFYSMICIMNICYKFKSPLRQLFIYE